MRRKSLVAGAVLTAVLALGALPDVSRSISPSSVQPVSAEAIQSVRLSASVKEVPIVVAPLDVTYESASHLDQIATLIEPGSYAAPTERELVRQPVPAVSVVPRADPAVASAELAATAVKAKVAAAVAKSVAKAAPRVTPRAAPAKAKKPVASTPRTPKAVFHGLASWYDNGTTAMRLPRGTRVKICGPAGCVTRTISDWGPAKGLGNRVVDLTPADFRRITGKSLGAGLAMVTVYVY